MCAGGGHSGGLILHMPAAAVPLKLTDRSPCVGWEVGGGGGCSCICQNSEGPANFLFLISHFLQQPVLKFVSASEQHLRERWCAKCMYELQVKVWHMVQEKKTHF